MQAVCFGKAEAGKAQIMEIMKKIKDIVKNAHTVRWAFKEFLKCMSYLGGCAEASLLHTSCLQLQRAGASLDTQASVVAACGLSACGTWAGCSEACAIFSGPASEPVSPGIGRWILNHSTTRDVPREVFFKDVLTQVLSVG